MDYNKIGSFIAEKRKGKGLTQKDLAKQIGVTDKAVSKWERGLGCPDVSILESLSKILDVSILELLNGDDIAEEQVSIDSTNQYIKNTVDYSKQQVNQWKIIVSKILLGIILFVGLLIIFLNIKQLVNFKDINTRIFEVTDDTIDYLNNEVDNLKNNIKLIEKNQGIYTNEEYAEILDSINDIKGVISDSMFLNNYNELKYLTKNDVYILFNEDISYGPIMSITNVLVKYNNNFNKLWYIFADVFLTRSNLVTLYYDPFSLYYYNVNTRISYVDGVMSQTPELILSNEVSFILYNYRYTIDVYNFILSSVIEVGEIYE